MYPCLKSTKRNTHFHQPWQGDHKFETSLGHSQRLCLKIKCQKDWKGSEWESDRVQPPQPILSTAEKKLKQQVTEIDKKVNILKVKTENIIPHKPYAEEHVLPPDKADSRVRSISRDSEMHFT